MAKKDKTEVMVVSPDLQKNIDILQAFKAKVDVIGKNCQQIKVVDETSLAVGQQNLAKANNLLTTIESKRKLIKEPYLEAGKLIDSTAKSLSEELSKGISHIKAEVAEWEKNRLAEQAEKQTAINKELEEKRLAAELEEKRKADIRQYINEKAVPVLKSMYEKCISVQACDDQLAIIEKNYKSREFFQEFADEAYQIRDSYIDLIKAKKQQLLVADMLSDEEKAILLEKEKIGLQKANLAIQEAELKAKEEAARLEKEKEEQEALAAAEKERLVEEANLSKTKGIRYTWDYEVVNKKDVPTDWLMVDPAEIKQYIQQFKESLRDGQTVYGIRFFKKMGVTA